jgi:hypothetical protein
MKWTAVFVAVPVLFFSVAGQDGIYGTFILGQQLINIDELNTAVTSVLPGFEPFTSNHFTLGGEGHVIVAKRFVAGGKGVAFFQEHEYPLLAGQTQYVKISGGMGVADIGDALIQDAKN